MPLPVTMGDFYTTAIVKLLSWNKVFAIFLLPAFLHHESYALEGLNSRQAEGQTLIAGGDSKGHRGYKMGSQRKSVNPNRPYGPTS